MLALNKMPLFVFLLLASGIILLIPCPFALMIGDAKATIIFACTALVSFVVFAGFILLTLEPKEQIASHTGAKTIIQTALAFLVLPIIFAIPIYNLSENMSFFDAYFEMVSALTTTGMNSYSAYDLPPIGHFWRGFVGWFGGGLMWVMAVGLLLHMEHSPTQTKTKPLQSTANPTKIMSITIKFFPIYTLLTLSLWVILIATNMPIFDALMVAMATFSTSGIVAHASSLSLSNEAQIFIVIGLFFAFSRTTMTRNITAIFRDYEMRTALLIIIGCASLLWFSQMVKSFNAQNSITFMEALNALWQNIFLSASFLSTTGFLTDETISVMNGNANAPILIIAMALCALGGGIATTASGFKLFRFYILLDHSRRELNRVIHPSYLGEMGILVRSERIKATVQAWNLLIFSLAIFVFATLALGFLGYGFKTALVLAVASLANTGPLINLLSTDLFDFTAVSYLTKSLLIIIMILGRIEILGAVAFLSLIRNK